MSDKTPLHDPLTDAFDSFRGDALPTFNPPGPDAVRVTVRRRQRNRSIAVAACAVVALVGTGVALANVRPPADGLQPAPAPSVTQSPTASGPTPSTSVPPSSTASTAGGAVDIRTVDWRNTTIPIAQSGGCAGGLVPFKGGNAKRGGHNYEIAGAPAFGDIDGDGRDDAIVPFSCGDSHEPGNYLVGVSTGGPTLRGLGTIGTENWGVVFTSYDVSGGVVVVGVRNGLRDQQENQTRRFRWNGTTIVQISGPTRFEDSKPDAATFDWSTATMTVPFKGASTTIQPNDRSCPRATVTFTHVRENEGAVQTGGCEYWIKRIGTADLDGDGTTDALLRITATVMGTGDLTTGASWYFGYTVRGGKPALLGFVTAANLDNRDDTAQPDVTATVAQAAAGRATVTQVFRSTGKPNQTLTRTFTWNGSGFSPGQAPPHPKADSRP
jgi:hypothetical protein